MAKSLLGEYIQSWGQTNYDKTNSLTLVAQKMGYEIETTRDASATDRWGWKFDETKYPQLLFFIEEVRNINRGNMESEVVQLSEIIRKYTLKPSRWEKVLSFLRNI